MSLAMTVARGPYRGDPGLGSILKKGLKIASRILPGVSSVTSAIDVYREIKGTKATSTPPATVVPTIFTAVPPRGGGLPVPSTMGGFGGGGGGGMTGRPIEMMPVPAGGRPAGMRLNKSSYFLKSGEFVPAGSRWVKIRRRNPLNPRALDRAIGRLTSAQRASKKMQRIHFGPPHRRAPAKATKRKR